MKSSKNNKQKKEGRAGIIAIWPPLLYYMVFLHLLYSTGRVTLEVLLLVVGDVFQLVVRKILLKWLGFHF